MKKAWVVAIVAAALTCGCGRNTPAPEPTSAPASQPNQIVASVVAPGSVHVNATYNAGGLKGTVGDTGAKVLLVPMNHRGTLGAITFLDNSLSGNDRIKAAGAYFAVVGGDGNASLTGVKPGSYKVYLFSGQTLGSSSERDANEGTLRTVIDDATAMSLQKLYFGVVEVTSGQQAEVVHDFGRSKLGQS